MRSFLRVVLVLMMVSVLSSCGGAHLPASLMILPVGPTDTRQALEVLPSGKWVFDATLTAWSYDMGIWRRALGPYKAVIGRNGFAALNEKKEGDGKTPSGVYPIGLAFGRAPAITTGLHYRQAKEEDIWIDDPASPQYNQWASLPTEAASFEQMLRPDGLYDMGAVIDYNTSPVVAGNGSAIFIHIWRDNGRKPTAGCVALEKATLKRLLEWLNARLEPVIILGTNSNIEYKGNP